ncbi:MAG: hypothetical protein WD751_04175 [Anaerolineales bacterium]
MDRKAAASLKKALGWIRAGKVNNARRLLVEFLRTDPNNAQAWYLLSYTLEDTQRKQYALMQALQSEPRFQLALSRLAKLRGEPEKELPPNEPVATLPKATPEPAPDFVPITDAGAETEEPLRVEQSEGRRSFAKPARLFIFAISMLLLVFLILAGVPILLRGFPASAPSASATHSGSPTAFASSTPTRTATPTSEPTLVAAEIQPLDPETQAALDAIGQQVAALRGLPAASAVESALIPANEASLVLAGVYFDEGKAVELQSQEMIMRTLGLLGEADHLSDYELRRHTDPLGGFYVQVEGRIYLVGDSFAGALPYLYARLYGRALIASAHAQVEQAINGCSPFSDACRALRALVQGDASLAGDQWLQSHGTAEVQQAVDELTAEPSSGEQASPGFAAMDLNFPEQYGAALVEAAFGSGGWGGVDALYASPPVSSEQLLHAEKFSAGEVPAQMSEASFGPAFGSGWAELETGELGEWLTFLILAHGAASEAQLDEGLGAAAAAGWGGDQFQAYTRPSDAAVALAAHWVMDSEADAGQLGAALEMYVAVRFGEEASALGAGNCWAALGQRSCVYARGAEVLWLVGPDEIVVLQVMLTHFPQFQ